MSKALSERMELRISPEDLQAIDDLRRLEPDVPPRSEMIRRLIERARGEWKGKRK